MRGCGARVTAGGGSGGGGEGAGLGYVLVHLGDQGGYGVEAFGAAEADGEVDGGVGAVEVQVVAVEGVCLDRAGAGAEGRVGAYRDRGGPAADRVAVQVEAGQPACVDAVGGDRGVRRGLQVRGREAEAAAAHVTADHDAFYPVRAAERDRGGGHVARRQALPDVTGGDRHVVKHEQRHALGGEVVLLAKLREQRHVARGLVAEPEVLADDHGGGVQPLGQHHVDELVGGQPGELEVEREHAQRVGA
jgi:hypothetical protein